MSAGGIKFTSGINSGPLWPEHDKVFLLQTCLARPGGWVKPPAPGNDLPGDVVRDVQVFQVPHVFAEAGAGSLAPVSEVVTMAVVSAFEGAHCDSCVKFRLVVVHPCHFCFIYNSLCQASPIQWADSPPASTVTAWRGLWHITVGNFGIVPRQYLLHVWHGSVQQLNSVPGESKCQSG